MHYVNSCDTLAGCLGAVGRGSPAIHCLTLSGQWALKLLQQTASLPGGRGHWDSFNELLHCVGVVGSATPATHTPAMHCLTAGGQWAVELLQYTA